MVGYVLGVIPMILTKETTLYYYVLKLLVFFKKTSQYIRYYEFGYEFQSCLGVNPGIEDSWIYCPRPTSPQVILCHLKGCHAGPDKVYLPSSQREQGDICHMNIQDFKPCLAWYTVAGLVMVCMPEPFLAPEVQDLKCHSVPTHYAVM